VFWILVEILGGIPPIRWRLWVGGYPPPPFGQKFGCTWPKKSGAVVLPFGRRLRKSCSQLCIVVYLFASDLVKALFSPTGCVILVALACRLGPRIAQQALLRAAHRPTSPSKGRGGVAASFVVARKQKKIGARYLFLLVLRLAAGACVRTVSPYPPRYSRSYNDGAYGGKAKSLM
jgi:hypothetical protein